MGKQFLEADSDKVVEGVQGADLFESVASIRMTSPTMAEPGSRVEVNVLAPITGSPEGGSVPGCT